MDAGTMNTILVLGSKPRPCLPDRSGFQDLACANASGYTAASLGLPPPRFTVVSAIVTSGIPSGKQSLRHMTGLETETLYYLPQLSGRKGLWRRLRSELPILHRSPFYLEWRLLMRPWFFRRKLQALPFHYRRFVARDYSEYLALVLQSCGGDAEVMECIAAKRPSTGVFAIALALSMTAYQRVVVAGFSFELTHAYGLNPEIAQRGTERSRHADTDIAILRAMTRRNPGLCTTEEVVHRATGIPLLQANRVSP